MKKFPSTNKPVIYGIPLEYKHASLILNSSGIEGFQDLEERETMPITRVHGAISYSPYTSAINS